MEALNTQLLRFFDWLLWASLQGTVLIIFILLIQKILRRRLPVRWHYIIWLLSKMSIFNLVPRSVQQGRIIESFSQSRNADSMGFYMHARSASAQEPENNSEAISVRFARMLPLLWLLGTSVIAGYVCVRNISLWRTVKRERPITNSEILDLLEDCKMQMGIQTIVGIIVSDRIKSPALFGFVRPRLLLPQGMLETYGLEELRYVFIHELAHLKQRDIYFGWLMALLQVVHWFNPLMWFAFGRMRADRELACDRLAISTMGPDEPPEYGRTIVSLLESFSQVRYLPSVAGILEDTCQMERRIKMITDYKKTPRPRWAGAMLLLAVLACVVLTNAYIAKADFIFGTASNLGPTINTEYFEGLFTFSADGLELYFSSDRPGGHGGIDMWVARRETIKSDWGTPINLGSLLNSVFQEGAMTISADGLELIFSSDRPGNHGGWDLWSSVRVNLSDPWEAPINLGPIVNSKADDAFPSISPDGLTLYFSDWWDLRSVVRNGGYGQGDIWKTTRDTVLEPWSTPVNLGPTVNSSSPDDCPWVSPDGLFLLFCSDRSGGYGREENIWMSKRATINDPWDGLLPIGPPVSSTDWESGAQFSPDGFTLYFLSTRPGGLGIWDIWQVPILPIVDFNLDGNINTDDLLILIGYWGQNEPLCDIGPTPYGDGIVDIKDMEVFMSYWEQENIPEAPEEEL